MKKYIAIVLAVLTFLTFTGCGKFDLDRTKIATSEEIKTYIESKGDALAGESYSYEYEMKVSFENETEYSKERSKGTFKAKVFASKEEERVQWSLTIKGKLKEYAQGKTQNGRLRYRESGVTFRKTGSLDAESYVDIYLNGKNASLEGYVEGRTKLDYKTDDIGSSQGLGYLAEASNRLGGILSEIAFGYLSGYKVFIDEDDVTLISSANSRHVEIVILFDGKNLTDLRIKEIETTGSSRTETEHIYKFGEVEKDDIKEPKNKDDYKK